MTEDLVATLITGSYIAATLLFILGLKQLSSPKSALGGNRLLAAGMFIALVATLFSPEIESYWIIVIGTLLGGAFGVVAAKRVKMTAMPQMVALFNGAGGLTAALVSVAEYLRESRLGPVEPGLAASIVAGVIIGSISFSGSLIAFGKLQEVITTRPLQYPLQRTLNALIVVAALYFGGVLVSGAGGEQQLWILLAASLALGVLATLPIGGGDMPVVIALLNSFTGLATAIAGLQLNNEMLIVAGVLVGSSGTLLTLLMSRAMNRSIANVLFGAFGAPVATAGASATGGPALVARETSVEDLAVALAYARRVIFVPGYGMAVAQAQHEIHAVESALTKRGVDVRYAVHPVAGRMPGHMNVLLSEANVQYDLLLEMEAVNGLFESTDVAVIVGANDVVNPAAREDRASPIYGMPILDADKANLVVVLKRGMSVGFAGIDNALFYRENSRMLFGDAKKSLARIVEALQTV